ncbi:hypothetical protein [Chitinolyticbacter meiyuanensis]|uniref:hypothetical protein n=1 Tax=Chitinolyticbacter meiyuanensis TaxID=682798 RepID=UPI0011E5BCAB|nr:hypothetical protein [Chitinolyticbacter meiyuanensis]
MTSPTTPRHDIEAQRDLTENERVEERERRQQAAVPSPRQAPFEHDTGALAPAERNKRQP